MVATDPGAPAPSGLLATTAKKSIEPVLPQLWLRARSPDRVRRFGEALDEGEAV
jgi:hypothetical protein